MSSAEGSLSVLHSSFAMRVIDYPSVQRVRFLSVHGEHVCVRLDTEDGACAALEGRLSALMNPTIDRSRRRGYVPVANQLVAVSYADKWKRCFVMRLIQTQQCNDGNAVVSNGVEVDVEVYLVDDGAREIVDCSRIAQLPGEFTLEPMYAILARMQGHNEMPNLTMCNNATFDLKFLDQPQPGRYNVTLVGGPNYQQSERTERMPLMLPTDIAPSFATSPEVLFSMQQVVDHGTLRNYDKDNSHFSAEQKIMRPPSTGSCHHQEVNGGPTQRLVGPYGDGIVVEHMVLGDQNSSIYCVRPRMPSLSGNASLLHRPSVRFPSPTSFHTCRFVSPTSTTDGSTTMRRSVRFPALRLPPPLPTASLLPTPQLADYHSTEDYENMQAGSGDAIEVETLQFDKNDFSKTIVEGVAESEQLSVVADSNADACCTTLEAAVEPELQVESEPQEIQSEHVVTLPRCYSECPLPQMGVTWKPHETKRAMFLHLKDDMRAFVHLCENEETYQLLQEALRECYRDAMDREILWQKGMLCLVKRPLGNGSEYLRGWITDVSTTSADKDIKDIRYMVLLVDVGETAQLAGSDLFWLDEAKAVTPFEHSVAVPVAISNVSRAARGIGNRPSISLFADMLKYKIVDVILENYGARGERWVTVNFQEDRSRTEYTLNNLLNKTQQYP